MNSINIVRVQYNLQKYSSIGHALPRSIIQIGLFKQIKEFVRQELETHYNNYRNQSEIEKCKQRHYDSEIQSMTDNLGDRDNHSKDQFFSLCQKQNNQIIQQIEDLIDLNAFEKLTESHILESHSYFLTSIDICEQRNLLVSGSYDCTEKLWNLQKNKLLKTYNDTFLVQEVVLSTKGNLIAYGGQGKVINLVEISDLKESNIIPELKGHQDIVSKLTFPINTVYLISGSFDENMEYLDEEGIIKIRNRIYSLWSGNQQIKQIDCVKFLGNRNQNTLIKDIQGDHYYIFKQSVIIDLKRRRRQHQNLEFKKCELRQTIADQKIQSSKLYDTQNIADLDSRFILAYCGRDKQVQVIDLNTGEQIKQFQIKYSFSNSDWIGFDDGAIAITKIMDVIAYASGGFIEIWQRK